MSYRFTPLCTGDLGLVARWLGAAHVARWWDPAEVEIPAMAEALQAGDTNMFLVHIEERPFGFIQAYDPFSEPDHPYVPWLRPRTLGIDQFIGEADLVGLGHGPAFIDAFCRRLFDRGAGEVVVDPHPDNRAARRAYAKAGFVAFAETTYHGAPVVLMHRRAVEDYRHE